MGRTQNWLMAGFVGLTGVTGCVHTAKPSANCASDPSVALASLPMVSRPDLEPSLDMLQTLKPGVMPMQPLPGSYRGLTEAMAQTMAVQSCGLANSLEREGHVGSDGPSKWRHHAYRKHQESEQFRRTILHLTAQDLRNRQAGAALAAYYGLAEAEVSLERLGESAAQMQRTLTMAKDTRDRGLPLPVKYEELLRRELDLESNRAKSLHAIEDLNGKLRSLVGIVGESERLMPMELPMFNPAPVNVDQAIHTAMTYRPDLQLFRYLESELSTSNLGLTRELLGSVNALLGSAGAEDWKLLLLRLSEICFGDEPAEVQQRRNQIRSVRQERERQAIAEVRTAVLDLELAMKRLAISRDKLLNQQSQEADIRKRSAQGLASFLEEANIRQEVIQTRLELSQAMMAWQRARIALKQSQGLLVHEVPIPVLPR
ncbi:TolC family protein [Tuwongella immobilis]|uniref:Outer membrane efflux protein n=1 Tax=Tuwongella immobilis TaxID=692036 RepID=A0A6C2YHV5_9BACT|nr:hypothetical protein [Tuwongella immobilis]VIP01118.1 Uncharacterized protein OS=Singulisphaera acidiphila (strain ATCC BAA-1392 / DSM 18658 / VKM B-2454 / MOB10) GN=Sinac_4921 PE=4 SV=1 [Tuwongella immobilis]VTR97661.1 Uncharacterized protein OS=Singulisphaera acidiphila (strain ATCC BAA-1392 / DSM 18658 / VKM B-2454 / MOB10) GN=Sinac_4921 PE=4 SV=1 [Tuwongella immobilis]